MTVELYYFQPLGTNSGRVYLTLLEKGVPFLGHHLSGRDFEHLKPEYLKINPRGQVPAMVHDGVALYEGMTMNEYIDEAFEGPALRPANLVERERMRVWCRWSENDLGRCLMMINWNRIMPTFIGARDMKEVDEILAKVPDLDRRRSWKSAFEQKTPPEMIEESHRRTREAIKRIEAQLSKTPYFSGKTYSLADIDFLNFCGGILMMWMPDLVNEKATPAFWDWNQRVNARPAVIEMRAQRTGMPTQPPAQAAAAAQQSR
ncbi:MAG: glutathione S-transferase family protein [Alphaproteobacteria bacterium]